MREHNKYLLDFLVLDYSYRKDEGPSKVLCCSGSFMNKE